MKTKHLCINLLMVVALLFALLGFPAPARAAGPTTFIVTSTADAANLADLAGNGTCDLREAIEAANWVVAHPVDQCPAGGGPADLDTITFEIPGTGVHQINLADPLTIADEVILDGTTQDDYAGSPLIRLHGGNTVSIGLFFSGAPGSSVKGFMLTGFVNSALSLTDSDNMIIQGNYVGTDGSSDLTNGTYGISVTASQYVLIGGPNAADRNIIAGHSYANLSLYSAADHNTIRGNYIGVGANGSTPIPAIPVPDSAGITFSSVGGGASDNLVSGNLISGQANGIINFGANNNNNTIQDNKIGTDATGTVAVANNRGIVLQGGDGTHIYYNLISGNAIGIYLEAGPLNTRIKGNLIGTNWLGMSALPNTSYGIQLNDAPAMIGDSLTPGYNVIAGNSVIGIFLTGAGTSGTTIMGNKLGRNANGSGLLPNGAGASFGGIYITADASAQVAENWISGNNNNGIFVSGSGTVAAGSTENCFTDGVDYGAKNTNPATTLALTDNWWGSSSGPYHAINYPSGLGDPVSDYVNASSFLTMPPPACGSLDGPRNAAFEDQLVGSSGYQTIVLTNNGNSGGPIMLNITTGAPFSIDASSTCPTNGGTLGVDVSCNLVVKFKPASPGVATGNVSILTVPDGEPFLIPLAGTGVSGTQLLKNPGFETDADHNNQPDKWLYTNFAAATDSRDCTVFKTGACSLRLAGNNNLKTVKKTILLTGTAGDDFTFSLWSRSSGVPAGSVYRLQIQVFNDTTLVLSKSKDFTTGTHNFQQVSGSFTVPGDYTRVVFKISLDASAGRVWFDTASLKWAP